MAILDRFIAAAWCVIIIEIYFLMVYHTFPTAAHIIYRVAGLLTG